MLNAIDAATQLDKWRNKRILLTVSLDSRDGSVWYLVETHIPTPPQTWINPAIREYQTDRYWYLDPKEAIAFAKETYDSVEQALMRVTITRAGTQKKRSTYEMKGV